jgi:hypothetical protein
MSVTPEYIPPQPQGQQQPLQQPPQSTGCLKWCAAGCGLLFVLAVGVICVLVFVVFAAIKSTGAYTNARDQAVHDPRVAEALGEPIETGWWVGGSVHVNEDHGRAKIFFPISGPKGGATVHVVATRDNDRWVYSRLVVNPDHGPSIDLLAPR